MGEKKKINQPKGSSQEPPGITNTFKKATEQRI